MAEIAAIVGVIGSVVSAVGSIAAGNAQARAMEAQANALEYNAKIEDQKAMQERAVAQRKAMEHDKQGRLLQSKSQNIAAASGASATDPTVAHLGGEIAGAATYYHLEEMATGETAARFREDQAELDRYSAANARDQAGAASTGGFLKAAGTVLGGASSAFSKFGGGTTLPTSASLTPSSTGPSYDSYFYNRQTAYG